MDVGVNLCDLPSRCSIHQLLSSALAEPGAFLFFLIALSVCKKQVCANVTC